MGRLFSWLGCYGVQERSGANDGEGWSCINEGRWKEQEREEDRKWWWSDGWEGPDELIGHGDER